MSSIQQIQLDDALAKHIQIPSATMFCGAHSAFGLYSERALAIMAIKLCNVLALLLNFRYQLALYFCCNLVALLILWLFCAHMDPLEESDAQRKPENSSAHVQDDATSCNTPQARPSAQDPISSGDQTPTVSRVQPKVSFLDLRLTDTRCMNLTNNLLTCSPMRPYSHRSLQDSIWATPTKSSPSIDKTPTRNAYTRVRADHKQPLANDDLSSNRAESYWEESTLQDKMKAFERKNMRSVAYSISNTQSIMMPQALCLGLMVPSNHQKMVVLGCAGTVHTQDCVIRF